MILAQEKTVRQYKLPELKIRSILKLLIALKKQPTELHKNDYFLRKSMYLTSSSTKESPKLLPRQKPTLFLAA